MDVGYTYADSLGTRLSIYVVEPYEPPDRVVMGLAGEPMTFVRVSDARMHCGPGAGEKATGGCKNFECHRKQLGECQCGRHRSVKYD